MFTIMAANIVNLPTHVKPLPRYFGASRQGEPGWSGGRAWGQALGAASPALAKDALATRVQGLREEYACGIEAAGKLTLRLLLLEQLAFEQQAVFVLGMPLTHRADGLERIVELARAMKVKGIGVAVLRVLRA